MTQQWCVVKPCVALADSPHVPYLCRAHDAMGALARRDWENAHGFHLPVLVPVDCGRIVYQRPDGSRFSMSASGPVEEPRL